MSVSPTLQNPTHELVQKYTDKLLYIKQQMTTIEQQQAGGKFTSYFQSPVWTEVELATFEQAHKLTLPEEYKVCLMEIGEISKEYFRGLFDISLRNRLVKDYTRMKKKAISSNKTHHIGSLYGKGWIKEDVFIRLKEEDKFRLYRKVPLFAPNAGYNSLFQLKFWNSYKEGCLELNESIFLILNGDFTGEIWKYGSEPEGEYAPSKYRECFTPINEKRLHLLDFISQQLTQNL